jgi:hypothetical protein
MILFDLGGNKIGFFELERFFKLTIFWKLFYISEKYKFLLFSLGVFE